MVVAIEINTAHENRKMIMVALEKIKNIENIEYRITRINRSNMISKKIRILLDKRLTDKKKGGKYSHLPDKDHSSFRGGTRALMSPTAQLPTW